MCDLKPPDPPTREGKSKQTELQNRFWKITEKNSLQQTSDRQ